MERVRCGILDENFFVALNLNHLIWYFTWKLTQLSHSVIKSYFNNDIPSHLRAFSAPFFSLTQKRHHPSMDVHSVECNQISSSSYIIKKNIRNYLSSFVKREKYFLRETEVAFGICMLLCPAGFFLLFLWRLQSFV
jgi:hypothetical protein